MMATVLTAAWAAEPSCPDIQERMRVSATAGVALGDAVTREGFGALGVGAVRDLPGRLGAWAEVAGLVSPRHTVVAFGDSYPAVGWGGQVEAGLRSPDLVPGPLAVVVAPTLGGSLGVGATGLRVGTSHALRLAALGGGSAWFELDRLPITLRLDGRGVWAEGVVRPEVRASIELPLRW